MGRCEWEAEPATMTSRAMEPKTAGGKSIFLAFPFGSWVIDGRWRGRRTVFFAFMFASTFGLSPANAAEVAVQLPPEDQDEFWDGLAAETLGQSGHHIGLPPQL